MRVIQNSGGDNTKEKNTCTVRSLAIAYNIPYSKAHKLCKAAGRMDNKGYYMNKIMSYVWNKGYKYIKIGVGRKGITLRRFLEQNPIGIFICTRRGHAFTVIHGEVHDMTTNTERQIVTSAYLVLRKDMLKDI